MPTQSKRQIKSSPIVKPGSKKKSKLRELSRKEEDEDDRQYMMLRHSPRQEEEQAAEEVDNGGNDTSEKTHYIPKSPDGRSMVARSLRGRRAAAPSTASRQVSQQEATQQPQEEEEEVDDTTISQAASVLRGVSEDANSLTIAPTQPPPTPGGGQTLHNLPSWRYQPSRSNLGEDLSIGPAPSWGSIGLGLGTFDYGDYNSTEPMELSAAAALAGYSPGTLLLNDQYVCGSSVITPATTIRKGMTTGLYPPSSPITKASGSPKISEDGNDNGEELSGEWLPPREGQGGASSSERREKVIAATVHVPPPPAEKSKTAQPPQPAYHPPEEVDPRYASYIQPQFIRRQPSNTRSSNHHFYQPHHAAVYSPPRYHPSVVGASRSHSNDSSESPGHSLLNAGGRVQVVGGAHHEWDESPWSVVSRSRSAESSGSIGGGGGGGLYSNEWEPPKPNRTPMAPTPGRPTVAAEYRGGDMIPPPPHSSYHPEYDSYSPDKASSSLPYVGAPYHPSSYQGHGRPPSGSGYRRQYPPSSAYPPHHHHHPYSSYPPHQYYGHPEDGNPDNAEPHPLLKNYNPHKDGIIRPQFQYLKKSKTAERRAAAAAAAATRKAVVQHGSGGVVGVDYVTPRRRRCRDPNEKAAAAAAMAAAAAVKFKKEKDAQSPPTTSDVKEEQDDKGEDEPSLKEPEAVSSLPFSEEELKTLGSGDDEDIPAAKRAAMASVLALREAAGGSPVPPPKSASEVTFDITNPPDEPIIPPSTVPVIDSLTQMTENDVLCGRGGGTNSTMGNRHYRALVRDFQPTYLMALRREKPSMARSAVLIIRNRGGRFLRRDETDGRLYEVGDEKAEAKTSQALREGLDVRATKSAANALRGTTRSDGIKKRKNSSSSDEGSLKKTSKKLAEPVIKVPKHLPQPVVHSGQHGQPPPGYRAPPPHGSYYSRGPPPGHYYHSGPPPPGYHHQWYPSHPGVGAPQFMRHGR